MNLFVHILGILFGMLVISFVLACFGGIFLYDLWERRSDRD